MEALSEILLVVQIITVVIMVAVILIQKSSSDGFTGNSSPTSFLSGRAQANLFTKITAICATIFLANSLVLAYLASHTERETEVIKEIISETEAGANKELTVEDARKLLDETSQKLEGEVGKAGEKIKDSAEKVKKEIKKLNPQVPVE